MRGTDEKAWRKNFETMKQAGFAGVTQVQLHIHPNAEGKPGEPYKISRAAIRELGAELRARGIVLQALPYTDDRGIYAQLLDLGVASFATDYPDVTLAEIKAYYARHRPARKS